MNDNSKASSAVSSVSHTNSCLPPTAVLALAAALCALAPVNGSAQERLYVLVSPLNSAGPSAIVAFEVDPQGLLTQRESYPTGGSGSGGSSEQELALHPSGRFLFAPNNASSSVSVFSIGTDGTLSSVPGSPFATGNSPMAVALNPNGEQAYVSVTEWQNSAIQVFSVDSFGEMSPTQAIPVPYPRELQVDPLGRCLYVADMISGLRAYDLRSPDGQLREIPGSPFSGFPVGRPYYARITSDGRRACLLDLDAGFAAYHLALDGTPSFAGVVALDFPGPLQLMPANNLAYVGFWSENWLRGFSVDSDAVPTELTGSPFVAEAAIVGLACSPNGSRLYAVTRENARMQPFAVAANGSLTKLGNSLHLSDPSNRLPNGVVYWANQLTRLRIDSDHGGGYSIHFTGAPAVTYRLQRATDVTGPWDTLATLSAPASGLIEYHHTTPLHGQGFYRTAQP